MVLSGRVNRFVLAAGAFGLFLAPLAGCSSPVSPPFGAPYSQTDLKVGTGDPINDGLAVTLNYTGWLYDPTMPNNEGAVLDTTVGGHPVDVLVGGGNLIQGFEQALPGMKVGGIRRVVIPPSLGYGKDRSGLIPPSSTLIFEIELVSITP